MVGIQRVRNANEIPFEFVYIFFHIHRAPALYTHLNINIYTRILYSHRKEQEKERMAT